MYAPAGARAALFALHGLDLELAAVVVGTTEPMIGQIRLAWWREACESLDRGVVPAQPLLQLIAAELLPRGISGTAVAKVEDRWLDMIGTKDIPATHVIGGGQLFAIAAQLLGGDAVLGDRLGRAWVTGDMSGLPSIPSSLRPLFGLVRLAVRDAVRARAGLETEARGNLSRQWVLLRAIALGR